ncbi:Uncharacterized protein Rs2_13709 [Raphanus sativus]|nr:Uncharacterized protein Rs2_13709 [Raphanus sativus]
MEGVGGGRLGRSSTRYGGPATVFTGPVRKWKKKWVHVSPSAKKHNNHSSSAANGSSSQLLLFKWAPLSQNNEEEDGQSESLSPSEDSALDPRGGADSNSFRLGFNRSYQTFLESPLTLFESYI